ncbi:MAG: type IX secretion system membrane protein PorP/SprF [Bacteroidota bacterium]
MFQRFEKAVGEPKKFVTLNYYSQLQHLNLLKAYMRSLLFGIILFVMMAPAAFSQQDPQYTMYMFDRFALNPAYAGALEATNVTLHGRSQWVGIPGAPNTMIASINGYSRKLHGGLGAFIVADELGPLTTFGVKGAYSFHLNFNDKAKLNIGVQGGIYQKTLDGDWQYNLDQGPDPSLPLGGTSFILPDIDAGIYFHVPLKGTTSTAYPQDAFYIGGSVSHLLEPSIEDLLAVEDQVASVLPRNIHATVGGTIKLDESIFLQPSGSFRMAGPTMQWDVTANLYVSPMVFGLSYRNADSFSGILGFNASTYLFMGYSYDYTVSNLGSFTTGSHEIILSYTFPSKFKNLPPRKGTRTNYTNEI